MSRTPRIVMGAVTLLLIGAAASTVNAAWIKVSPPGAVPAYYNTASGRTWTVTVGKVRSDDWGKAARRHVQKLGYRLPSFAELQQMYDSGGGSVLNIQNGLLDYYETDNPMILGNAFGNGFRTPQNRKGVGYNYVIGVR